MPGYWNDDQGGGQAPPSYPVNQPSGGHPGGWVSEPSDTFSTPPQPDLLVDTTLDPVANVSTGTGSDDLKVQAQQARAAEEKQKYIDKLKGYAASMSSSPGLYGSLYGPGAEELFNPYDDPTLNRDLYNLDDTSGFSGDIPITEYQKLKFLADYGMGSGLGSFMATDDFGNPILTSEFIRDEDGNLIPNPSGGGNIIKTGLGEHMSDNWAEAFDPGGLRYGDDPLTTGGSAIREYLEDVESDYWKNFDQNWYGMDDFDYAFYGGGGPRTDTAMQDLGVWGATPLSEIESVGFDQFVPQYEKEFTEERIASPLHVKGMTPAGFEYLGSPEFGTRFYEV